MKKHLQSNSSIASSFELFSQSSSARIVRLWPDEMTALDPSISDNNKSEVLWIQYAGRSILLCGDIEEYAQRKLLELHPDLKANVLLLPHHGSKHNIYPEFIRKLGADIRLISCGRNRLTSVIESNSAGQNWYTPLHGAVTIIIKADGTLHATGFIDNP